MSTMGAAAAAVLLILGAVALFAGIKLALDWRGRRARRGGPSAAPAAPSPGPAPESAAVEDPPPSAGSSPPADPVPAPDAPMVDPAAAEPGADPDASYLEREPALSDELGSGGQGRILSIADDPEHVFKQLAVPVRASSTEFQRLVALQGPMERILSGADVDLVWPRRAVLEDGAITGYVMPRFPQGYTLTVNGVEREASLMYAVPKDGPFAASVATTPAQRLALVTAVGRFLAALHHCDYVYGDVSWSNMLFRVQPRPSVLVFDVDGVRRVGALPALSQGAADTVDWRDPAVRAGLDACFDSDRYKFALLAYRLLVALSVSAPLPQHLEIPADRGISTGQSESLRRLWARAVAGGGGRPAIAEWLAVLEQNSGA